MSDHDSDSIIHEDRLWKDDGWTARVVKNEDDEGWAVAMFKDGESEPALVGPWTMGRDKKNPKPLAANAFSTLIKTASEVLRRHEQQRHAALNKSVSITQNDAIITVMLPSCLTTMIRMACSRRTMNTAARSPASESRLISA